MTWRVGRRNGRVIYRQLGDVPDRDTDVMIGAMDTPELAARVVLAVNGGRAADGIRHAAHAALTQARRLQAEFDADPELAEHPFAIEELWSLVKLLDVETWQAAYDAERGEP